MREYTVSEETSLQNFTDTHDAQASFVLRALLKRRDVRVNGVKTGEDVPLHAGDRVQYFLTPAEEGKRAFSVLYADEDAIVIDKESGVQSEAVFSALQREGECHFLHRLDRNTEGLMIFARKEAAARALLNAFREHRVRKRYLALVKGTLREKHAVLKAYLKKDAASSRVRIFDRPNGEPIVTEYRVLEEGEDRSLLEITLHTGKTHQIRAHFAHIGHPVLGDTKYGDAALNRKLHLTRQKLIAKELCFTVLPELPAIEGVRFFSEKSLKI